MKKIFLLLFAIMMAITSIAGNKDNLPWTEAPKATYTKQMGKILRLLQQNDLVKADKAMVKLEEDSKKVYEKQAAKNPQAISYIDALYPLWDVALCLKDCKSEDDSSAKLWSTYEHLKKIIDHGERLQETDAFLAMPGIATSLAEIREHMEQALIAQTRAINSEEAYVRLLGTITDGPHHAALINEIEALAYNLVLKRGEIKEYERYLSTYTANEEHRANVTTLRDQMIYDRMPKTVESYKRFLADYPDSRLYDKVQTELYELAYLDVRSSVRGCQEYLREYPGTHLRHQIEEKLEEYAYSRAVDTGMPMLYREYLAQYPQGKYADLLREQLPSAEASRFLKIEANFYELEDYVKSYTPADPRITNFYRSLIVNPNFYRSHELQQIPPGWGSACIPKGCNEEDAITMVQAIEYAPIGLIRRFHKKYLEDIRVYDYKIDKATGVISCAEIEFHDITFDNPKRKRFFTCTIKNGVIVKDDRYTYEYDDDLTPVSRLDSKGYGTYFGKDGWPVKVIYTDSFTSTKTKKTYTYNDRMEISFASVMEYNPDGVQISNISYSYENSFGYGWSEALLPNGNRISRHYQSGCRGGTPCTPYYNLKNEAAPIVKIKEIRDLGTKTELFYYDDSSCGIKASHLNEWFSIDGYIPNEWEYDYMISYGGKSLALFTESFAPIEVYLPEFGIDHLELNHVYEIVFEDPHDYTHIRTVAEAAYVKAMTTGNNQVLLDTPEIRAALRGIIEVEWDYLVEGSSRWEICRVGNYYHLTKLTSAAEYRTEIYYDPDRDEHYGIFIGDLLAMGECWTYWITNPAYQSIPESFRKGYAIKFW